MQNFLADRSNDRPVILLAFLAFVACSHLTRRLLYHFDPHGRIPQHRMHHFSVLIPFQILKFSIAVLIVLTYLPSSTTTKITTNPTTVPNIDTIKNKTHILHHRRNLFTFILLGYTHEIISVPTLSQIQLYHHVCVIIPFAFWLLLKLDDGLSVHETEFLYAIPTVMVVFGIGIFESAGMGIRVLCMFRGVSRGTGSGSGIGVGTGTGVGDGAVEERESKRERNRTRVRKWVNVLWRLACTALIMQWFLVVYIVIGGFREVGRVMGGPEALGCLGLLVVWGRTEWVAIMGVGRLVRKFEGVDVDVRSGEAGGGGGGVVRKNGC